MPALPLRPSWLLPLLLLLAGSATAATPPQPFDARYHLQVAGWPDADIQHQLQRTGIGWQSEMSTKLPGISGHEMGRFRLDEDGQVQSLYYASGYSLLGIQRSYRLERDALQTWPDRQSALFALSRQAIDGDCTSECRVHYLDHRGHEERVDYRVTGREMLELPAGRFEALRVEVTEPGEPDRRLVFDFLPRMPGLLLSMGYYRDGERRSHLTLTHLNAP
ncbi:hypothetical protein [Halomonas caseinilytica]|uniref:hypothetical protein n=1 Tax=Halomonas caseinilytica TaxID=438744 RepID=UPI0007E542DB|nr:hypothetical protein [Halomonas caseinilytica]SEM05149.1 hypothetical protein SAMN04487952_101258 [Halomonas caseinilytica]